MIFVVLGTQKFQCNRLLKMIDNMVGNGYLSEEVYAQKGHSSYKPENYQTVDFLSKEEFDKKIAECSLLITHGGVGTILSGINNNKPVIVFPRLKKYKEHVDNHQLDIARAFYKKNLVLMYDEEENNMRWLIEQCRVMHFETYTSQRDHMIEIIRNYISRTQMNWRDNKDMEKKEKDKNISAAKKPQIDLYINNSQVMNDAIDRIVVEIHNKKKEKEGAKKILLTGCGPQCGSTSTCIGLGISFSEAKWKTLVIDCDLRKQRDFKKLNEKTGNGLSDFLLGNSTETANFEDIIYPTNFDNLSYIPCGRYAANPARLFCSGMMKQLLKYADENYDYVIFDFPSVSVSPDAQILFGDVDGIILVSALDGVTKRQVRHAKQKVQPYADKYYGMIINKIQLDLYKKYVKRFDYYFIDRDGMQKLGGSVAKKYKKNLSQKKEDAKDE